MRKLGLCAPFPENQNRPIATQKMDTPILIMVYQQFLKGFKKRIRSV